MMSGAAPTTPFVDDPTVVSCRRRFHKRGAPVEKISRRIRGEQPSLLDGALQSNEMKNLSLGGRGGRIDEKESNTWKFAEMSSINNTEDSFVSKETSDAKLQNNERENETYRKVDLTKMQEAMNEVLVCNCFVDDNLKSFSDYCVEHDHPEMSNEKMNRLLREWKQSCERKKAKSEIKIEHDQLGFESCTYLVCNNCNRKNKIKCKEARKFRGKGYNGKSSERENCAWYESNFKVVLGTLAAGIGAADMEQFLHFIDLPIPQSFPYQTFNKLSNLIGESLRKVAEKSMKQSLLEEVEKETGMLFEMFWQSNDIIGIFTSYDMGWNKRSSGNRFDSLSGFAFLIGCKSKKIIAAQISSKKCNICAKCFAKGEPVPEDHKCPRNHEGSSKSMEADAALQLIKKIFREYAGRIYVKVIVSDDDSTMKAILKHEGPTSKKGKLPLEIPEPTWLADPSHRVKVVASKIYALAALPQSQSTCLKVDAVKFKMNFGYMLKRCRDKGIEEISKGSLAVIEHSFNSHSYCNAEWCRPLRKLEKQKKISPVSALQSTADSSGNPSHPHYPGNT